MTFFPPDETAKKIIAGLLSIIGVLLVAWMTWVSACCFNQMTDSATVTEKLATSDRDYNALLQVVRNNTAAYNELRLTLAAQAGLLENVMLKEKPTTELLDNIEALKKMLSDLAEENKELRKDLNTL